MSQPFNIRDVISQSTSDVTLSELAKKGFKKVKVLHKDTVNNLVREAVDRVIEHRIQKGSSEDKEEIVREARAEFMRLAKDHSKQESAMTELQGRVQELESEANALREQLKDRYAEIAKLQEESKHSAASASASADVGVAVRAAIQEMQAQAQQPASEIGELKEVIELLASKLSSGGTVSGGSGGLGSGAAAMAEPALENLFAHFDDISVESNLDKVQAKSDKASGVSKSLNKLKSLKGEE